MTTRHGVWRGWLLGVALALGVVAQEGQKSSLQVTTDEDGDVAVVMDTESIRMTVLPAYQACIAGFIFKPTGNDILARQSVKHTKIGSGLLQDNFWEQDWRFSEFRHKWYDFKILSQGPEELVVSFWTTSAGWLQADKSGVISDLISNIKIERTIRMPAGKPFFLCDVTLSIDQEKDQVANAKLPQFWVHNSSLFTDDLSDEYQRPHVLGIAEQTPKGSTVSNDFVYNPQMARGWSAQTSPRSREGIVYLMDPDYVQSLYNCGNSTLEWFADNMLITRARPLKTRIYILPVIGLDKVHFADPHMILKLEPRVIEEGEGAGQLELGLQVSPSYKQVRGITFAITATYGLHERAPTVVAGPEPLPVVRNLRVEQPRSASTRFARADGQPFTPQTPVLFDLEARVELVDAAGQVRAQKVMLQFFHLGGYPTRKNAHLQDDKPLAVMKNVDSRPFIPTPEAGLKVGGKDFRLFLLGGPHVRHYRFYEAMERARTRDGQAVLYDAKTDAGFSVGFPTQANGLSSFPYDFERLFAYRVLVNCNTQTNVLRLVGQAILASYLQRGGGYLTLGGEAGYSVGAPAGQALGVFEPFVPRWPSITVAEPGKPAKLQVTQPNHPIFKGDGARAPAIKLDAMPVLPFWHTLALKQVGTKPFLPNPREHTAVRFSSLPAPVQAAIKALPAERRRERAAQAAWLYGKFPESARARLAVAGPKVAAALPATVWQTGVIPAALSGALREEQRVGLREAFLEAGDDEKELLNLWLDISFGQPNIFGAEMLTPELAAAFGELIQRALALPEPFLLDGDLLILPEAVQAELLSLFRLREDELPAQVRTQVLMEVEDPAGKRWPFLVETQLLAPDPARPGQFVANPAGGRVLSFANSPFGDPAAHPGVTTYLDWDQWPLLLQNALLYCAREL